MRHYIVIGVGFGDEGKGTVVDYLCSNHQNSLVVRFNGGHQAGHTVYLGNANHIFSTFGSGTLRGASTYLSEYCTVDPISIENEYNALKSDGFINVNTKLFIDPECPITTPYDVIHNVEQDIKCKYGSCRKGVSSTFEREENHYSLKVKDLFYPKIFDIKLKMIQKYYDGVVIENAHYNHFMASLRFIMESSEISIAEYKDVVYFFDNVIWEGAQGLLLDQKFGFFPHVTRSNCGSENIKDIVDKAKLYLVMRAYQTRHGNGPMTNEGLPYNITENQYETNCFNEGQGNFRKSILDLDLIEYAINSDKKIKSHDDKTLVITNMDQVTNAYCFTYRNELFHFSTEELFVRKIGEIFQIKNILVNDSPWSKTIRKIL